MTRSRTRPVLVLSSAETSMFLPEPDEEIIFEAPTLKLEKSPDHNLT
jgi:hypothetical protein